MKVTGKYEPGMSTINQRKLSRPLILTMAIASGVSVANLYYSQPLLVDIQRTFHASIRQVGFIPMCTQLGYALGMLMFVPLGDMVERRKLIVIMLAAVALALIAAAVSPSLVWLTVASLAIGVTTIVPQLIVPFAASLANPAQRGKVVGTVMSGLLIGILLARTVSGFVGAHLGWRAMYWIAAGLMALLALVLGFELPESRPSFSGSYLQLMRSLPTLIKEQPVLREAALIGALLFGAFSVFWTTLVFLLEVPPYHYGSQVAGLFGLVGAVGALGASFAGRFADKRSPVLLVGLAIVITILSYFIFSLFGLNLWGLILGVVLLDLGVQAGHVTNQTRIYSLSTDVHNRVNTVYMVTYFIGGSIGSALGSWAWSAWGWNGVSIVGLLMLALALIVFVSARLRGASTSIEELQQHLTG
jgi:predicted MFS family arabinose efflux permease